MIQILELVIVGSFGFGLGIVWTCRKMDRFERETDGD
jgi:hypothetical protein